MHTASAIAIGYGPYLLVVVMLTLSGLGLLRLARAGLDRTLTWLLAPCVGQALLACLLGLAVGLRQPLKHVTVWLDLVMAAAAVAGAYDLLRPRRARAADRTDRADRGTDRRRVWACLTLACLLPFVSLWPYLDLREGLAGYRGSGLWDGWGYVAIGQYVWDYPRGASGGLPVFYQFGAAFSESRFVASAQLPFLASVFRLPDAQTTFGLLEASGLFTALASCAAFAWTRRLSLRQTAAYLAIVGASGWFWNVIWANNCDHLLALAYFPALFAIIDAPSPLAAKRWLLVLLAAASLYTYPELAWLGAAAIFLWDRLRLRPEPGVWWTLGSAAAIAGLLLVPYGPTMWRFVGGQTLKSMASVVRPGDGMFGGLLAPAWTLSAVWGLGGEHVLSLGWHIENLAGLGLCLVFLVGLMRLVRAREYGLAILLVAFVTGVGLFGIVFRYSYGAYKMLLTSWWLIALALVLGVGRATSSTSLRRHAWLVVSVLSLLAVPVAALARGVALVRTPGLMMMTRILPAQYFRSVGDVAPLTHGSPVALLLDDVEANKWALFYLRDQPLRVGIANGYMGLPAVRVSFDRARSVPWESIRHLLADAGRLFPFADAQGWTQLWTSGPYRLWDTGAAAWAVVTGLTTPNGLEMYEGRPFFWMGGGPTRIEILANARGVARLSAEFWPGPSVPVTAGAGRRLAVTDGEGCVAEQLVQAGAGAVQFGVKAGFNVVTITPVDPLIVSTQANGDRRPLVLGARAPRLDLIRTEAPPRSGCAGPGTETLASSGQTVR
jgi:hypothetical protein